MFTCCPKCETCFRITEEQLTLAKGLVRCGHCQKVFNGRENITAALPENRPGEHPLDQRHEADPHDSGIFSAGFSATNNTDAEQAPDKLHSSAASADHFDLPSFFAHDDFADPVPEDDQPQASSPTTPANEIPSEADDALADDWFLQDSETAPETESESPRIATDETYEYSDISDGLEEERDIDDIFSDMHQQLEQGMSELKENAPGAGVLQDTNKTDRHSKNQNKRKTSVNDEDEINQAIDSIFNDSELPLYGEQLDEQDYRVEKEMLAAFGKDTNIDSSDNIQFEDEAVSLADLPHPLEGNLSNPPTNTPELEVPRRLRDSLAVAEPEKTSIWKIFLGLLLSLLLAAILLAQLALFRNIEIVNAFPQTRPWLEQFCRYTPCRIHTQHEIDKIHIVERDIRAHPQNKNALQISATIINKARFGQPYPDIQVSLSDLTGTVVAQRRFTPDDYLGSLNSPFLLMKPGTPVHIRIEVLDPGRDAVSFEFQFL